MIANNKISRRTLGNIMVWLGVLVWIPYVLLISNQIETPLLPYLLLHLIGVLGGVKLRGPMTQEHSVIGKRRRKISRILIYGGVMAWLPFYYINGVLGQEVDTTPFLFVHLTGIIGGVLVRGSIVLSQFIERGSSSD